MNQEVSLALGQRKRARSDNQALFNSGNISPTDANIFDAFKRVLSRVDELEGTCARLETRCRSLECTLQAQQQQHSSLTEGMITAIVSQIDTKFRSIEKSINSKLLDLENSSLWIESLLRNQKWKYSAPTIPISYWICRGFDVEYVEAANLFLEDIEALTSAMRRGECSDSYIHLGFGERFDDRDNIHLVYDDIMLTHWMEFVNALEQYHWFLNRSSTGHDASTFILSDVQIPSELCFLLERALALNHFKRVTLQNNHFGRYGILMAIKCIESNPKLVEFILSENEIESSEDAERLSEVIKNHPTLATVSVKRSCSQFGSDLLRSVMDKNCKLTCIDLPGNNIKTQGSRFIFDFLSTNPVLRELTLEDNHLNDDDAAAIAVALKTNTNLKCLILRRNDITCRGVDALLKAITDPSSLSSAASCNHSCQIYLTNHEDNACINLSSKTKLNRGDKLYNILSSRNAAVSNTHEFDKFFPQVYLPVALESIQKYAEYSVEKRTLSPHGNNFVPPLSIIYEILKNWDKTPDLFCQLGSKEIDYKLQSSPGFAVHQCV